MCSESRQYPDAFSFQVVTETDWKKFNFVAGMVSNDEKSHERGKNHVFFSNEVPLEFRTKVLKLCYFCPSEICVENMVKKRSAFPKTLTNDSVNRQESSITATSSLNSLLSATLNQFSP